MVQYEVQAIKMMQQGGHIHKECIPFAQYIAILVVAAIGFVTEAFAQEKILSWDGEAAARLSSSVVRLNGPNGEVVATINTETLRRIVEVKDRIAGAANQPAHLYVLSGTEPNAVASMKDGTPKIAINVAMINLLGDDYDAYAAIIGHELAHLVRGHGATRESREGARSVISSILGTILGHYGIPLGGTIANIGTTAVTRTFSRDEEREADNLGLGYMKQAGYDPMGGVRAWERMGAVAKSRGVPFLSTHPAPEERLETMRTLARNYAPPSPVIAASPDARQTSTPPIVAPTSILATPAQIAAAPSSAGASDLYTAIDRLRAGEGNCAVAERLPPLRPQAALERVARDLARGDQLQQGLNAAGYRATRSRALSIRGDGVGEQAAGMLAKQSYCQQLQDAAMSEVGIYLDARQLWIVMAVPFAPLVGVSEQDAGARVLDLVNQARATPRYCGNTAFDAALPVRWNDSLTEVSRLHAEDMARYNYFSHSGRDGSDPAQRIKRAGYSYRSMGENIAGGQVNPEDTVAAWIKSPESCPNLMNPAFTEMGVAFAVDRKSEMGVYWTQVFGTPR